MYIHTHQPKNALTKKGGRIALYVQEVRSVLTPVQEWGCSKLTAGGAMEVSYVEPPASELVRKK